MIFPKFQRTYLEDLLLLELNESFGEMTHAQKLRCVECLFKCITQEPPASFRRLIYERLGFGEDSYERLYLAGGMTVTNALTHFQE